MTNLYNSVHLHIFEKRKKIYKQWFTQSVKKYLKKMTNRMY